MSSLECSAGSPLSCGKENGGTAGRNGFVEPGVAILVGLGDGGGRLGDRAVEVADIGVPVREETVTVVPVGKELTSRGSGGVGTELSGTDADSPSLHVERMATTRISKIGSRG